MLDERLTRARGALEPAWDEHHEQRLLMGIISARRRILIRRARVRRALPALAAAALATVLVLVAVGLGQRGAAPGPVAAGAPAPSFDVPPVLSFTDGSRAVLSRGAQVETREQNATRVVVEQRAGAVRYEIRPGLPRAFVVRAAGVKLEVIGTVFELTVDPANVTVHVERGRVRVTQDARDVELGAGESLRLAIPIARASPVASAGGVVAALPRRPTTAPPAAVASDAPASAQQLLARADLARRAGRSDEAASALTELVTRYSQDQRALAAWFTLGRLERARGRHAAAASAFQSCRRLAPGGPLAEDALAEEASSLAQAGSAGPARAAARLYLEKYPAGSHADRMRRLSE